MRPPIEHYVRCSVTRGDYVVEPGLEICVGDDFDALTEQLAQIAGQVASRVVRGADRIEILQGFGAEFEDMWPGRAWFVEIHDAKVSRWTQSYQPYGIPRE